MVCFGLFWVLLGWAHFVSTGWLLLIVGKRITFRWSTPTIKTAIAAAKITIATV
jgi:hypothetical protein